MRTRRCNACKTFTPVSEWEYGCPACGWSNLASEYLQISEYPGVLVMPDIKPYQSMINGQEIGSRSSHREHLRRHNFAEVGNDSLLNKPHVIPDTSPQRRKEIIVREFNKFTHAQFKQAVKNEVEHIRWNSRKD